ADPTGAGTLGAWAAPVVAALLARPADAADGGSGVPHGDALEANALHEGARAGWIGAALVISWAGSARAARFGGDWHARDGLVLGALPLGRAGVALAALVGIVLGSLVPCATSAAALAWTAPGPRAPLELAVRSGPERSVRLAPGARLAHAFALPAGTSGPASERAVARVRLAPTVGGASPTSRVRVTSGDASAGGLVVRRTELEVPLASDGILVENRGEGAVAVLGPAPFEVWRPTHALLGGHLRMAAHVALACTVLFAAVLAAGAWIGPLIAGGFGLALVLLPGLVGSAPVWAPLPAAGGPLLHGLDALASGRAPNAGSPRALLLAVLSCAAAAAVAAPALGRARDGGAD
ncbi:MAG: hypothetical protein AAFP22_18605, partial [Planctomycetota bacterium]